MSTHKQKSKIPPTLFLLRKDNKPKLHLNYKTILEF